LQWLCCLSLSTLCSIAKVVESKANSGYVHGLDSPPPNTHTHTHRGFKCVPQKLCSEMELFIQTVFLLPVCYIFGSHPCWRTLISSVAVIGAAPHPSFPPRVTSTKFCGKWNSVTLFLTWVKECQR
jgi:hypothetical protein